MPRSFDLVDEKVAESDFFLEKLADTGTQFFKVRWYFSAFLSAARSITFALQATMNGIAGFDEYYQTQQQILRADPICRSFHDARTQSQHIGINPVSGGMLSYNTNGMPYVQYFFAASAEQKTTPPESDVLVSCRRYMKTLVELIFDCYVKFGPDIDPHQHYTAENFAAQGKSIDDAEEDVFGMRGWTDGAGIPIEYRWQIIRDNMPGCQIDHLFESYVNKRRPTPERLEPPQSDHEGSVWIPEQLRCTGDNEEDYKLYIENLRRQRDQ